MVVNETMKKVYVQEMWPGRWVYAISNDPKRIEGTWSEWNAYPSRRRAERRGREALKRDQHQNTRKKWHVVD